MPVAFLAEESRDLIGELRDWVAIDDSLAHEYAHFIQHRYQAYGDGGFDDAAEGSAVEVQTWFRDEYIRKPGDPCAQP